MIKTMTAFTSELDDEKTAIEQISSQLKLEEGLLKNTIGIVVCHYEFILSGIFKAVCDALPFSVVGTISSTQAVNGENGSLLMALTVMTSDTVEFEKIITPSIAEEPAKVIAESYKSRSKSEKPALAIVFVPFILQNCGDDYVNALSEASGGVPCFGTLSVDDTLDFVNCFMLADGEHYRDKMAMILLYGDVKPKFFVANISESRLLEKNAVVTKSAGHVLMEVNERPVIDYFDDLGLVKASETQYAMSSIPFLIDYNDDTPKVSKVFVMLTPEKYAICGGAMPEGSTMYVAMTDKSDVIFTTEEVLEKIRSEIPKASLLLAFSCLTRNMMLGAEQYKEMEMVNEKIGGELPFMMASSGGEICPTKTSDERAVNRFHNNAFVACLI